jgi:hypothetical protein
MNEAMLLWYTTCAIVTTLLSGLWYFGNLKASERAEAGGGSQQLLESMYAGPRAVLN